MRPFLALTLTPYHRIFPLHLLNRKVLLSVSMLAVIAWQGLDAIRVSADQGTRPNIVFIMTDDQGYGDVAYLGNPVVKTPHLDRLAAESSRLSDYHVAPTCSPTRAALLTGRWTNRTGVWHTVNGRSMLREDEVTFAQILQDHGYATGLFGKWHLGDNFPYRAEDRGFTEVFRHGGGGVGQTPDLWNNAYFDGHYYHNGNIVPAEGFCTDVFFREAWRFIRESVENQQPFLAYIPTNAPHGPLHAPPAYMEMYADQPDRIAAFLGMITNIDDNVGATRELLRELEIEHNTLLIFTSDNGTASGASVFNAGMRGAKGSEYEGGHRVPFFAHWPAAGWNRDHSDDTLCHAVDILPTLLEIADAPAPPDLQWDGRSLVPLLDPARTPANWPDRMLVTDSQRVRDPIKWKQTAVMSQEWRLINGKELYRIKQDPGQQHNVIEAFPEQAARMIAFYDAWWAELEPTFAKTTLIPLGHPQQPTVQLTGHDWIQEALPPWNQAHIRQAYGLRPQPGRRNQAPPPEPGSIRHQGHWAVRWEQAGKYEVILRRWPTEVATPITAGLPAEPNVPGADRAYRNHPGQAIPVTTAVLRVNGQDLETKPIPPNAQEVRFTLEATPGEAQLAPYFRTAQGDEIGAYYVTVGTISTE